jgi:DNA-directed RNA polymerase subunit alpha
VRRSEGEMLKYRNFGKQSLKEITEILQGMGLHLGMDIDAILEGRAPKPAPPSELTSMDDELSEVENS